MNPTVPTPNDPLYGLKILDFTTMMAGPLITRMLSDLGAEVFKIEPPAGEHMRNQPPVREGVSSYFGHLNAGKKSVVLDLKSPAAIEQVRKMAAQADTVVENFRPGVMKRLGLDYDTLREINPRLVYCSVSGFGQTGPYARRPAYAQVVHAESGFDLVQMQYLGLPRPPNMAIFTGDVLTGIYAANAIQAAIIQRFRTGTGQHLDVTLMDSMLNLLVYEIQEAQFPAEKPRNVYRPVETRNGFLMIIVVSQAGFEDLARAIGHPEWIGHPKFGKVRDRFANWETFMDALQGWAGERTIDDCEKVLQAAGIPCARYRTAKDAFNDPELRARGSFAEVEDAMGRYYVPALPWKMSAGGGTVKSHVSSLGEHTAEALAALTGAGVQDLQKLKQAGAFGSFTPAAAGSAAARD